MRQLRAAFPASGWPASSGARQPTARSTTSSTAIWQMHIDDNVRAGMTSEQARRARPGEARGGRVDQAAIPRDQRSVPVLEHAVQDLRFAVRQLRHRRRASRSRLS